MFADMGSGKSTVAYFVQYTAFNTSYTINPTKSYITRTKNKLKCTTIIDERENINDSEDLKLILNGSYTSGSSEGLTEQTFSGAFVPIDLDIYSPSMLCTINPIFGATADRIIKIDMVRASTKMIQSDNDIKKSKDEKSWSELREQLFLFGLLFRKRIIKEYKNFVPKSDILKNRPLDIWKPIFAVNKFFSSVCCKDSNKKLYEYYETIYSTQKTEELSNNWSFIMLQILDDLRDNEEIPFSTIHEKFKGVIVEWFGKSISMALSGTILRKIGYTTMNGLRIRKKSGIYFIISHDQNKIYKDRYFVLSDETKKKVKLTLPETSEVTRQWEK